MTETPKAPNEEIPAFRVSEKRVDDEWKEQIRREREAASHEGPPPRAPSPAPGAPAAPAAPVASPGVRPAQPKQPAQAPASAAER